MGTFTHLTLEEASELGIRYSSKIDKESGELRARLTAAGIDVSITQIPRTGWQNAHRHEHVVEVTLVVTGKVVQVEQTPAGALLYRAYREGDTFRTQPGFAHNLFVWAGTTLSTVKLHDDPGKRDWIADPELDAAVRDLTEEQVERRALMG